MISRSAALAAVLLIASSSNNVVEAKKANANKTFLKAMSAGPPKSLRSKSNSERKARFYKNLLSKARYVEGDRKLEEADDDEDEEDIYGFDVTQYSIKYGGCSTIKTYSDDMAANGYDTVLENKRFVVFRMCPTNYCNKYSTYGCSSNYGEYILSMDEYLEEMAAFNEENTEEYCQFCEECVYAEEEYQADDEWWNNPDYNQYANGDDANANGDDAAQADQNDGNDDAADAANDDAANNQRKLNEEQEGCDYYEQCQGYADVCVAEGENDGNEGDQPQVNEFFECVGVDVGDDDNQEQYYIGPHCGSDAFSITLGVYSDEFCSNYVGDKISVADVLGYSFDSDEMDVFYPKECTSCDGSTQFWLEAEANNDDDNQEDNVLGLCEVLYDQGAKCHQKLNVEASDYYSQQQIQNEEKVCNFINQVRSGDYDEHGDLRIVSNSHSFHFNLSDWKNPDQYSNDLRYLEKEASNVTPARVFFLVIFISGTFVMSIWACMIQGELKKKNIGWRPRRGKMTDPRAISRQLSGIMMGRSVSGSSKSTPLV